jgi:hypothetical protein
MAKMANRDTYALEHISGVDVRRVVKAGDIVPDHYVLEDGELVDVPEGTVVNATRRAPAPAAGAEPAPAAPAKPAAKAKSESG